MFDNDKNSELTLLPHYVFEALKKPSQLTANNVITLGSASVCGWIAYSIYDDFLDEEGVPARLPVANCAMRESLDCFRSVLPNDAAFYKLVSDTFTAMDEANVWEVIHCRFILKGNTIAVAQLPDYGDRMQLAARSFAHALAPLAVMRQQLIPATVDNHIKMAFRHYLIARQLSDDMHDWYKDMKAGHASYVVATILRDMQIGVGDYELAPLLSRMQRHFRQSTMLQISNNMLFHLEAARQYFKEGQLLTSVNDVYGLLNILEQSTKAALDTYFKGRDFVEHMNDSSGYT